MKEEKTNSEEVEVLQKFLYGDLVKVGEEEAIVLGSYIDECFAHVNHNNVERNSKSYALFFEERGYHAWFEEDEIQLIKEKQFELLGKWQRKHTEKRYKQLEDLKSGRLKRA